MARLKDARTVDEPGGLWHQPALMNLMADLLIVLSTAALAWSALTALQRLPLFPLRELVVNATPDRVSVDQLEHAARTALVGNFFTVDLDAARAVFEKLPWVRKATVQRQWPSGLALTLEEHELRARWQPPNEAPALVNSHGEVFVADAPSEAASLPLLSGPEGSAAELLQRHGEFGTALAGLGRRIDRLSLSPRLAWQIRLDDGLVIELGRDKEQHPLAERLDRFVAHYDNVKARMERLRVADMRYPNGFALVGGTGSVRAGQKS